MHTQYCGTRSSRCGGSESDVTQISVAATAASAFCTDRLRKRQPRASAAAAELGGTFRCAVLRLSCLAAATEPHTLQVCASRHQPLPFLGLFPHHALSNLLTLSRPPRVIPPGQLPQHAQQAGHSHAGLPQALRRCVAGGGARAAQQAAQGPGP